MLGSITSAASSLVSSVLGSAGSMPLAEIFSYSKADFSGQIGSIKLPFIMDTTNLQQTYGIKWGPENANTAQGESAPIRTFGGYDNKEQKLVLDVMVDATGVHKPNVAMINYNSPDVSLYLEELKRLLYGYNKEGHSAPYLKLVWGAVFASESTDKGTKGTYYCVLEELEIDYKIFSAAGKPVRAEVKITLLPFVAPPKRPQGNSPDLTHMIEIKHGDNLPKLCKQIYEDERYYHDIVRVNNLPSAYAIKPGMQLLFPPLDKVER